MTANYFDPIALLKVIQATKNNSGAEFTATSKVTEKHYTFKINRYKHKNVWYTGVAVSYEYLKYSYLGNYQDGVVKYKGKEVDSPSARAIAWLLRRVEADDQIRLNDVETQHFGKCIKCGKPLTDPASIQAGLGPTCRK